MAELLGIEPGSMVIRREEITTLRGRPRMLAVDWIPTRHVMAEAELLGPTTPEGPERVIADRDRTARHPRPGPPREPGSRHAGSRSAQHPGRQPDPGRHPRVERSEGVILYGEWVMPPKQVITYTYEVTGPS